MAFIHWVPKLHVGATPIPPIPCADLPRLSASTKTTSLTRNLASFSRKSSISPFKLPVPPSPPSPLPSKSKTAAHLSAIPFPFSSGGGSRSPTKSSVAFSQTPWSRLNRPATDLTPRAPRTSVSAAAETAPNTPSSSRREALYERLRQRSLSASPTKAANSKVKGGKLTSHQLSKMGQDELRRRCLLSRLNGVAASVWMSVFLFLHRRGSADPFGAGCSPRLRPGLLHPPRFASGGRYRCRRWPRPSSNRHPSL
jgi:hypothetical protein